LAPSSAAAATNAYAFVGSDAALPANAAPAASQVTAINSVSCASVGNCSAVGTYTDNSGYREGLLLTETEGVWASGVEAVLPDDANTTRPTVVLNSVSCASPGNCAAVGAYQDNSTSYDSERPLLLTETDGTWGPGVEGILPADALPDSQGSQYANLTSVSCASPGSCTAVGTYTYNDHVGSSAGLLFTETNGTWGSGVEAPLPANATADQNVLVESVSCTSAGNCVAVGGYSDGALLLTETNGTWGEGVEATPPPTATAGTEVLVSVSCVSAGNCSAVGSDHEGILLLTETGGTWGTGVQGTLPANASDIPIAGLLSVSCGAPGNCSAVGSYRDNGYQAEQGLLVDETDGTWAPATEATVPADGGTGPQAATYLSSVSCASPGNCSAVGEYNDSSGGGGGLLLTETSGSWATGTEWVLPADALGSPLGPNPSISCPAVEECTGVSSYGSDTSPGGGLLLSGATTTPQATLTISKPDAGQGTVTSSPAGIDCGSTCIASFDNGTEVTLTATPEPGSYFAGWSVTTSTGSTGSCAGSGTLQVGMSRDKTVTACFRPISYNLTVQKSGNGRGTVASSPSGISCGSTCAYYFADTTPVTLTATPNSASTFTGWSGGGCSGTGTCQLTLASATTVTATFTPKPIHCTVPNVKGKELAAAKHAILAHHCTLGKITKATSTKVAKGKVISEKPPAGTHLKKGAKISLVVSRGAPLKR
jgi:hypothetical protein